MKNFLVVSPLEDGSIKGSIGYYDDFDMVKMFTQELIGFNQNKIERLIKWGEFILHIDFNYLMCRHEISAIRKGFALSPPSEYNDFDGFTSSFCIQHDYIMILMYNKKEWLYTYQLGGGFYPLLDTDWWR